MFGQHWIEFLAGAGMLLLVSGCGSLLPTGRSTIASRWAGYDEVQDAFDLIETNRTTAVELRCLGFDPAAPPNVKVLNYVEIIERFMPNQAIRMTDLHPTVREFIEAKEQGRAYELQVGDNHSKRHGNLFLDILGFKRQTHESGWHFKAVILLKGDVVSYKLASGQPAISRDEKRVRPLGPLQELEGVVSKGVDKAW